MDLQPVYIVSGYMRSGTSMMMKSLMNGGIPARFSTGKDRILDKKFNTDSYHPNPEGYFELETQDFENHDFPSGYSGFLIKALHWRLHKLPLFNYNIVFMLRNPEEIKVSYLKMFRHRPPFILEKYSSFIEETLAELGKRKDMKITTVWHHDMLKSPGSVIEMLIKKGFPVKNKEKAVSAVRADLYRSRPEDLQKVSSEIPGLRTDLPDHIHSITVGVPLAGTQMAGNHMTGAKALVPKLRALKKPQT